MSLNIKNERVHQLAREAARLTGKSQTGVIEEALVRLLRDYDADPVAADRERRIAAILALGHPSDGDMHAAVDDLYDETTGLPR